VRKIIHVFLCAQLKYAHDVIGLSMNSLAAQAFIFFVGGFETSSSTMTFCLYELSLHQDIQDRLREEIDDVLQKHDGKITYEGIREMEYLDKVVSGKTDFEEYYENWTYTFEYRHFTKISVTTSHKFAVKSENKNQSKLPVFSSSEFFSFWSNLCFFNISVLYRIHTSFRIFVLVSVYFTLRYTLRFLIFSPYAD